MSLSWKVPSRHRFAFAATYAAAQMADQHSLSGGLERSFNKRPTQWVRFIVTTSDKRQVVKINALGCMGLMVQDATTNLA